MIIYLIMIELPNPLSFQWDKGNIDKNLKKHGVTTLEAEELFFCKPLKLRNDIFASTEEERFIALGRTKTGRKLFAAFTVRRRSVRVISVRDMTDKERRLYERFKKNPKF
jgi:uncharacterized DUF497 family protein